ncbi:MAG: M42 family peptidase [Thermoprotei archaeon]|nr:MAG: M42 family peptidase [Thermoprotei archaeon]
MGEEIEVLKLLSEIPSPPGFEHRVRTVIKDMIEDYVEELFEDSLGNLVARIGRGSPKLMLAAHMDEIGFLVRYITDDGFLKVTNLGGVNPNVAVGSKVVVLAEREDIVGVLGCVPPHLLKAEKAQISVEELFVDIGASRKDEVLKRGVNLGTPLTFKQEFSTSGNLVFGKAFDDRLGCAVLVNLAKRLRDFRNGSIYLAFTVQEELGLRGATVAAYRIAPDVALSIEGTIAADIPGVSPENYITSLGKGPAIRAMDRSMVANPKLFRILIKVAEENSIPYQIQISPRSGTDAGKIQLARGGVAVSSVSVPARYIHSPLSVACVDDYLNAIKLLEIAIPEILECFRSP